MYYYVRTQAYKHKYTHIIYIIVITFDNTSNLKTRIMYRKLVEDQIFCDSEGAINNYAIKYRSYNVYHVN